MTRVFLAAGVAALAIAAPASADPHGGGGRAGPAFANRGGGGGGFAAPRMQRQAFAAPRMQRQAFSAPRMERRAFSAPRMQRQTFSPSRMRRQAFAAPRMQRQRFTAARSQGAARMHMRAQSRFANRAQFHGRMATRQQSMANRFHGQNRMAARQLRTNRLQQAQNMRLSRRGQIHSGAAMRHGFASNRMSPAQNRMAMHQQLQANGMNRPAMRQQFQPNRQAPAQTLLAQRRALVPDRVATADAFRTSRFAALATIPRGRIVDPVEAVRFVGQPVSSVTNYVPLAALPASVSYLYPDTPAYYYQYGGGYLYQVDRSSSLIDALIPLLAGGFMPGTYLPAPYMSSYVPAYYGLNSFYPADYGATCNRYAYGVVYQVDCATGLVQEVVPLYAGGYGVGQMLPSAYNYYNVPMQYRSLYYPTADSSYWYAPGAIYQYDPRSSLITSVAALMAPGFTVGQPLPQGYGMYNVPLAYRSAYYDTPTAWYRYNNGYIYQVDPSTMLVTSVVASLLS